jgi:hypothetical protein
MRSSVSTVGALRGSVCGAAEMTGPPRALVALGVGTFALGQVAIAVILPSNHGSPAASSWLRERFPSSPTHTGFARCCPR